MLRNLKSMFGETVQAPIIKRCETRSIHPLFNYTVSFDQKKQGIPCLISIEIDHDVIITKKASIRNRSQCGNHSKKLTLKNAKMEEPEIIIRTHVLRSSFKLDHVQAICVVKYKNMYNLNRYVSLLPQGLSLYARRWSNSYTIRRDHTPRCDGRATH